MQSDIVTKSGLQDKDGTRSRFRSNTTLDDDSDEYDRSFNEGELRDKFGELRDPCVTVNASFIIVLAYHTAPAHPCHPPPQDANALL